MITFKENILQELDNGFYYKRPEDITFEMFYNLRNDWEGFKINDLKECYDNAIKVFISLPNPIPIYRAIKIPTGLTILNLKNPGISWTFDKNTALNWFNLLYTSSYDYSFENSNFILSAKVDKKYVNWLSTFLRFWGWTWENRIPNHHFDENEIELKVNSNTILSDLKAEEIEN